MKLHSLKPAEGSLKSGKRIARGQGSGLSNQNKTYINPSCW